MVIKQNKTNNLRVTHYLEYFHLDSVLHNCQILEYKGQQVLFLKEPVFVPDLHMYRYNRISSLKDKRIYDVLMKMLWLNQKCSVFIRKKIVEYVLYNFVAHKKVESQVKQGESVQVPIYTHEKLLKILNYLIMNYAISDYVPDKKVYHFISKDHTLSKEDRFKLGLSIRWSVHKYHMEGMIDNAVDMLIDLDDFTIISTGRIHKKEIVKNESGIPVSYNTINNNISSYAVRRIIDTGSHRLFTDEKLSQKLTDYLDQPDLSLNELVSKFKISKTTAKKFKIIKENELSLRQNNNRDQIN